jgi:hypothetical protein
MSCNNGYMAMFYSLLVSLSVLLMPVKSTLAVNLISASPSELSLREKELELKKQEFEFKKQEAKSLENSEMLKNYATLASIIAIGIPVWVAAINVREQRRIADEQAKLQFRMKVAELALTNTENATQAKEKARALANLFKPSPLIPDEFAEQFDPKQFQFGYGSSKKKREEMIALLAQYPNQRKQILSDWYVLFRWDWWWIEPFLSIEAEEMNRLKDIKKSIEDNENEVNKKKKE